MFYYSNYDAKDWYIDSVHAFQCILNVLLEHIESFNIVQCILYVKNALLESIDLSLAHYVSIMLT